MHGRDNFKNVIKYYPVEQSYDSAVREFVGLYPVEYSCDQVVRELI